MGILADSYIAGSGFLSSQLIQDLPPSGESGVVFVKIGAEYVASTAVYAKVGGNYKLVYESYMKQSGVYTLL